MGFGYNPQLITYGERLDMLDFFSWMKRLQNGGIVEKWVIWDAAGYAIVNKIKDSSSRSFKTLVGDASAATILDCLCEEQNGKYQFRSVFDSQEKILFQKNCQLRSDYLKRFIAVSGINAEYYDSREVFSSDSRFKDALEKALAFVKDLEAKNDSLLEKVVPQSSSQVGRLYLPLEIAEALYLAEIKNVNGKFGPVTEEYFDACISNCFDQNDRIYATLRCPLAPNEKRPAYLKTDDPFPLTTKGTTKAKTIKKKLSKDDVYQQYVKNYLEIFKSDSETTVETIQRLRRSLLEREVS